MAPEHRQIGSCDGPPDRASMQFRRVRAHHYKLPFSEWASVFPEPRLCKAIELSALFGSHCSGRTRRLARGLKAVVNSSSGSLAAHECFEGVERGRAPRARLLDPVHGEGPCR